MNCDPVAPFYRTMEYVVFGRALERARFRFLDAGKEASTALIIADGDGRFTAALLRTCAHLQAESIDIRRKMLALAQRRLDKFGLQSRVRLRQSDIRICPLPAQFDFIATHFLFDFLSATELSALITRISQAAQSHSTWIVSEFAIPSSGWRRLCAGWLIRIMYVFFRISVGLKTQNLPNWHEPMEHQGFRLRERIKARGGLIVSELWTRSLVNEQVSNES